MPGLADGVLEVEDLGCGGTLRGGEEHLGHGGGGVVDGEPGEGLWKGEGLAFTLVRRFILRLDGQVCLVEERVGV